MNARAPLLHGKVAIISGVGPGLSRGMALELADHGAEVVLVARRQERLDAVAGEVSAQGGAALTVAADITRQDECREVVRRAIDRFGRVDVLVNNAYFGATTHPFLDTFTSGVWQDAMAVNLFGSLTMTHAAAGEMVASGGGSIVMVASMAIRDIQPNQGPYATSKAALVAATKTLARELGPSGVRVNAVVPGYIAGPAVDAWMARSAANRGISPAEVEQELVERMALRFVPSDRDIAGSVVWLASELARPVTGIAVDVNGGYFI